MQFMNKAISVMVVITMVMCLAATVYSTFHSVYKEWDRREAEVISVNERTVVQRVGAYRRNSKRYSVKYVYTVDGVTYTGTYNGGRSANEGQHIVVYIDPTDASRPTWLGVRISGSRDAFGNAVEY